MVGDYWQFDLERVVIQEVSDETRPYRALYFCEGERIVGRGKTLDAALKQLDYRVYEKKKQ